MCLVRAKRAGNLIASNTYYIIQHVKNINFKSKLDLDFHAHV